MRARLVLSLLFVFSLASLCSAFPRRVLIEYFTNTRCIQCQNIDPLLDQYVDAHLESDVAIISWHTAWPGTDDPWYAGNPDPVETRISYYGVSFNPDAWFDGEEHFPANESVIAGVVSDRQAVDSPAALTLTTSGGSGDSIRVTVAVETAESALEGSLTLRIVLLEHHRHYETEIGLSEWYHGFLATEPASGYAIIQEANSEQEFQAAFPWNDTLYSDDNLELVAFLQDDESREVLQAAFAEFIPGTNDEVREGAGRQVAERFTLDPVHPNPFNLTAQVHFTLVESSTIQLMLFDLSGRHVATLARGRFGSGEHRAVLAASRLASGLYVLVLQSSGELLARKVVVVK